MKYCPNCNRYFESGTSCPVCGGILAAVQNQQPPQMSAYPQPVSQKRQERPRGSVLAGERVQPVQRRRGNTGRQDPPPETYYYDRPPMQPLSKGAKRGIKIGIFVCAVLTALFIAFSIISYTFSAEAVAKAYIKAVKNKNYDKVVSLLNLEESEMLTGDQLKAVLQDENDAGVPLGSYFPEIGDYRLERESSYSQNSWYEMSIPEEADNPAYKVQYNAPNSTETQYLRFKVEKMVTKKFLVFDEYKVMSDGLVGKYYIEMPSFMNASVDGIEMEESGETRRGYEHFSSFSSVPMFLGEHVLQFTSPFTADLSYSSMLMYDPVQEERAPELVLSEEVSDTYRQYTASLLDTIYTGLNSGSSFDSLSFEIDMSEEAREALKNAYDRTVNGFSKDGESSGYKSLKPQDYEIEDELRLYDYPGGVCIHQGITSNLKYSRYGWSGLESGTTNSFMRFRFRYNPEQDTFILYTVDVYTFS